MTCCAGLQDRSATQLFMIGAQPCGTRGTTHMLKCASSSMGPILPDYTFEPTPGNVVDFRAAER